ncbi:pilus assembly PilX N-terminal domain-containing protein [Patescibacteria group bacterium]|nr:pilus assembly PilX N-terminal domain-containing protein [Patescibacteria group bacterium]
MFLNHSNFENRGSYKLQANKGFIILYATLISSLLLVIGLGIFNISIKELILSSAGRESQVAFYAADAGIECALYWDIKRNVISTSTSTDIDCNGDNTLSVGGGGWGAESTFTLLFPPEPYCAKVSIIKDVNATNSECRVGTVCTTIISRGYNTCDTTNPRRTERAIEAKY